VSVKEITGGEYMDKIDKKRYDGKEVYMSPRSVRAFNKRYNVMAPDYFLNPVKRNRMLKYSYLFLSFIFPSSLLLALHTPLINKKTKRFDYKGGEDSPQ
jgi:hypothetical protein